jgi:ribonuclease VapC
MIVDSSAVVAIVRNEPSGDDLYAAVRATTSSAVSAAAYLESAIVIDAARSALVSRRLDDLLEALSIRVEPVTEAHARLARQAYRDYGKGSGHPARLNFGDCFSYALAIEADEPLLFVGDDFSHTDVRPALLPPPRTK